MTTTPPVLNDTDALNALRLAALIDRPDGYSIVIAYDDGDACEGYEETAASGYRGPNGVHDPSEVIADIAREIANWDQDWVAVYVVGHAVDDYAADTGYSFRETVRVRVR